MADGTDPGKRIGALVGVPVAEIVEAGSRHGFRHLRARLADGRAVYVKASPDEGNAAAFAAEANGLRWLAQAGALPLPEVLGVDQRTLVLELLPEHPASATAAREFGSSLARLHAAGAGAFGAPWPGYIASLPLDNTPIGNAAPNAPGSTPPGSVPPGATGDPDWGSWYARRRLAPYLRRARDAGVLSRDDAGPVEAVMDRIGQLAGPPEPPSRIHGDLWSGNVLWSPRGSALIDPAAHGGHRETDLAMLALFGAPYLDQILRAYTETTPLPDGWRSRVPLHQLHPLLVHVCLFGSSYTAELIAAARAALRA